MLSQPAVLLRVEGAVSLALCLYCYHAIGVPWGWFLLLFLWPDLSMLGYLANVRMGANFYNLAHTATFPIALAGFAYARHSSAALSFAVIWMAHIQFDRALGYGLKYPTFFKDTHLQRV